MSRSAPTIAVQGRVDLDGQALVATLDFAVPAGQWTCLLGASGVGKTTLLRLIAGIEDNATLAGRITASDGGALPGRIALMAQDDLLMPWLSVRDNVMLGARLRAERPDTARADEVLGRVGLSGHAQKRPETLSGGERQRAALARTLMEDRPVVLLDEPFSALDARIRAQMQDLAFAHLAGRTVLMVTHDPAEAVRLGDQVLLLGPEGCHAVPLPRAAPPRPVDDPETLAAQGALLARLMAAA